MNFITSPENLVDEVSRKKIDEELEKENKEWENTINKFFARKLEYKKYLNVGKIPSILEILVHNNKDLYIEFTSLENATNFITYASKRQLSQHTGTHTIDKETIRNFVKATNNPLFIFKGVKSGGNIQYSIITDLKQEQNQYIAFLLSPNRKYNVLEFNKISSIFNIDNIEDYLKDKFTKWELVAVKTKANQFISKLVGQPTSVKLIGFDDNIPYLKEEVKKQIIAGTYISPAIEVEKEVAVTEEKENEPMNTEDNNILYDRDMELIKPEYIYYSYARPVSIGTYPKANLIEFENYDNRTMVEDAGREVWAKLRYSQPLTDKQLDEYEFVSSANNLEPEMPQNVYTYYCYMTPIGMNMTQDVFPQENLVNFESYDKFTDVADAGRKVWGKLTYSQPLESLEFDDYRLTASKSNPIDKRYCVTFYNGTLEPEKYYYESFDNAKNTFFDAHNRENIGYNVDLSYINAETSIESNIAHYNWSTRKYGYTSFPETERAGMEGVPFLTLEKYVKKINNQLFIEETLINHNLDVFESCTKGDDVWGAWLTKISSPEHPEDYIEIETEGISRLNLITTNVNIVKNNQIKEFAYYEQDASKMLASKNFEDFEEAPNDIMDALFQYAFEMEGVMTVYSNSIEKMENVQPYDEHYNLLESNGFDKFPKHADSQGFTIPPTVTIPFTESPYFLANETMSIEEAERRFLNAEAKAVKDLVDGGYYKTDFVIKYVYNGIPNSYRGRIDIGDGSELSLIDHIEKHVEYMIDHPNDLGIYTEEQVQERLKQASFVKNNLIPHLKDHQEVIEEKKAEQVEETEMEENSSTKKAIKQSLKAEAQEQEEEENANRQTLLDSISNIAIDQDGYVHFTIVSLDMYLLNGLYRTHDTANGEDNSLVSIEYGYDHPEIEKYWNDIESRITELVSVDEQHFKVTFEFRGEDGEWHRDFLSNNGEGFTLADAKDVFHQLKNDEISVKRYLAIQPMTEEDFQPTIIEETQSEKQRVFFDLDGVCALWQPVAEDELYEEGYYRNLPPYENVVKAINEITQENPEVEVYVLSKYLTGSKYALKEKEEWVKEHLPSIPVENQIFVPYSKNKFEYIPDGLRETDYLIDDYTNNFEGWQPPAKAIKLLNGINNTKGTWQGAKISAFRDSESLKNALLDVIKNGAEIKDLPPQLDNSFDYEAFFDERQGYKYSNFADNHQEMLADKNKQYNNRTTIVINAFGGAGAGKTVACMDICQQLKKQGYNAEYVSEYCKDLVYENSDMLSGTAKNQFKILQEQMRRVDRLIGQVDFVVTDSPILLNSIYNKELTPEYEEMVTSLFNQYDNFTFVVERDKTHFQTEGRIHTLEESIEKDNEIKTMLKDKDIYFGTYNHDTIHKVVNNSIRTFERISKEQAQTMESGLNITGFEVKDMVYMANYTLNAKEGQGAVWEQDGNLYIRTGSKVTKDLETHYLTKEQTLSYNDFVNQKTPKNQLQITEESKSVNFDGYKGTYYTIDSSDIDGKKVFLMESERYGEEVACLVVDEEGKILFDKEMNGFEDYKYHLSTIREELAEKIIKDWEEENNTKLPQEKEMPIYDLVNDDTIPTSSLEGMINQVFDDIENTIPTLNNLHIVSFSEDEYGEPQILHSYSMDEIDKAFKELGKLDCKSIGFAWEDSRFGEMSYPVYHHDRKGFVNLDCRIAYDPFKTLADLPEGQTIVEKIANRYGKENLKVYITSSNMVDVDEYYKPTQNPALQLFNELKAEQEAGTLKMYTIIPRIKALDTKNNPFDIYVNDKHINLDFVEEQENGSYRAWIDSDTETRTDYYETFFQEEISEISFMSELGEEHLWFEMPEEVQLEMLVRRIDNLMYEYDTYEYNDQYPSREIGIDETLHTLSQRPEVLLTTLNTMLEEADEPEKRKINSLINELCEYKGYVAYVIHDSSKEILTFTDEEQYANFLKDEINVHGMNLPWNRYVINPDSTIEADVFKRSFSNVNENLVTSVNQFNEQLKSDLSDPDNKIDAIERILSYYKDEFHIETHEDLLSYNSSFDELAPYYTLKIKGQDINLSIFDIIKTEDGLYHSYTDIPIPDNEIIEEDENTIILDTNNMRLLSEPFSTTDIESIVCNKEVIFEKSEIDETQKMLDNNTNLITEYTSIKEAGLDWGEDTIIRDFGYISGYARLYNLEYRNLETGKTSWGSGMQCDTTIDSMFKDNYVLEELGERGLELTGRAIFRGYHSEEYDVNEGYSYLENIDKQLVDYFVENDIFFKVNSDPNNNAENNIATHCVTKSSQSTTTILHYGSEEECNAFYEANKGMITDENNIVWSLSVEEAEINYDITELTRFIHEYEEKENEEMARPRNVVNVAIEKLLQQENINLKNNKEEIISAISSRYGNQENTFVNAFIKELEQDASSDLVKRMCNTIMTSTDLESLMKRSEKAIMDELNTDNVCIYQIIDNPKMHYVDYRDYKHNIEGNSGLLPDHYVLVHSEPRNNRDLEKIFIDMQDTRANRKNMHSLSVSDIVAVWDKNTNTRKLQYVDSFGFEEVKNFDIFKSFTYLTPEEQMATPVFAETRVIDPLSNNVNLDGAYHRSTWRVVDAKEQDGKTYLMLIANDDISASNCVISDRYGNVLKDYSVEEGQDPLTKWDDFLKNGNSSEQTNKEPSNKKLASEKQKSFAQKIANTLNIPMPEEKTASAYSSFIKANMQEYNKIPKSTKNDLENTLSDEASASQIKFATTIAQTLNIELPEGNRKVDYSYFISKYRNEFSVKLKENNDLAEKEPLKSEAEYLEMVKENGNKIKDVPQEARTEAIIETALSTYGAGIRYLREEDITEKICLVAVKQYGKSLQYVPPTMRTLEICVQAYTSDHGCLYYIPKELKKEVKEEYLKRNPEQESYEATHIGNLDYKSLQNKGTEWANNIKEILDGGLENPEAIFEAIAFAGKFYQYSYLNMEIMRRQNRGITYVGTKSHFEKMGYNINAEQTPMFARLPFFQKYVKDPVTKQRVLRGHYTKEIQEKIDKGELIEQSYVKSFMFQYAFYDISQTDCPPEDYPKFYNMGYPSEVHSQLFDAMEEFATVHLGFDVCVEDVSSIALRGSCNPSDKVIKINHLLQDSEALGTLAHEIGHAIMHGENADIVKSTSQKEVEADILTIMIQTNLGLPITDVRKRHLINHFTELTKEAEAKGETVSLYKLVDYVQAKVFRKYITQMNTCISNHVSQPSATTIAVDLVREKAYHDVIYWGQKITDIQEIASLIPNYNDEQEYEIIKGYSNKYDYEMFKNVLVPKYSILKGNRMELFENGISSILSYDEFKEHYSTQESLEKFISSLDLAYVENTDRKTINNIEQVADSFNINQLASNVEQGNIIAITEDSLTPSKLYFVDADRLVPLSDVTLTQLQEKKINTGYDIDTEYANLSALRNCISLQPEAQEYLEYLEKYYNYSSENAPVVDKPEPILSPEVKETLAHYTEKLNFIERYESMYEVDNGKRIINKNSTDDFFILNKHVKSILDINNAYNMIQQYSDIGNSVRYYVPIESGFLGYRLAYVKLNKYYEPEATLVKYSEDDMEESMEFNSVDDIMDFYEEELENSRTCILPLYKGECHSDLELADILEYVQEYEHTIDFKPSSIKEKTLEETKDEYRKDGLTEDRMIFLSALNNAEKSSYYFEPNNEERANINVLENLYGFFDTADKQESFVNSVNNKISDVKNGTTEILRLADELIDIESQIDSIIEKEKPDTDFYKSISGVKMILKKINEGNNIDNIDMNTLKTTCEESLICLNTSSKELPYKTEYAEREAMDIIKEMTLPVRQNYISFTGMEDGKITCKTLYHMDGLIYDAEESTKTFAEAIEDAHNHGFIEIPYEEMLKKSRIFKRNIEMRREENIPENSPYVQIIDSENVSFTKGQKLTLFDMERLANRVNHEIADRNKDNPNYFEKIKYNIVLSHDPSDCITGSYYLGKEKQNFFDTMQAEFEAEYDKMVSTNFEQSIVNANILADNLLQGKKDMLIEFNQSQIDYISEHTLKPLKDRYIEIGKKMKDCESIYDPEFKILTKERSSIVKDIRKLEENVDKINQEIQENLIQKTDLTLSLDALNNIKMQIGNISLSEISQSVANKVQQEQEQQQIQKNQNSLIPEMN